MPVKSTNTFTEWLQKQVGEISKAKMLPDALPELPWLTNLETVVLQKAHEMLGNENGGGQQVQPSPVAAPPMQSAPGGVMQNAPMPSPDELRRVLAQQG